MLNYYFNTVLHFRVDIYVGRVRILIYIGCLPERLVSVHSTETPPKRVRIWIVIVQNSFSAREIMRTVYESCQLGSSLVL